MNSGSNPKFQRLYHGTTKAAARIIETVGFRDSTGHHGLGVELAGVWVSDRPLEANETGSRMEVTIELDLADAALIAEFEVIEDGKTYREWCVPASLLNRLVRRLRGHESDC